MKNLLNEIDSLTWGAYHYEEIPEVCKVVENEAALIVFAFGKVQYDEDMLSIIKANCIYNQIDECWEVDNFQIDFGYHHNDVKDALCCVIRNYLDENHR